MNNWKLRHSFTGNATSDVQTVNGYLASGEDNDFAVTVVPDGKEYAAPLFIPRTNLVPNSENLEDVAWNKTRCTIDDNDTTGPTGVVNGSKMTSTDSPESYIQDVLTTTQTKVAWSFWAKKGDLDYVHGLLWDTSANGCRQWFNVSTGAVGGATSFGSGYSVDSASIKDYGNGWYRCVMIVNCSVGDQGCRVSISDGNTSTTSATNSYGYFYGLQLEDASVATEYIPTNGSAVTRDWSAFGRVQNQVLGISNGTHTHTGAASGSGIAATTITGGGSGATFAYDFDTLGVLTTLTADGAGSGYKVGDKLSIDTTEGHTIEFRLVEGSNASTVSVSMGAAKPNKPIPFPVSKMRVEGLTDRTVLFMDERSRYVFPKPTPYLLDTYEGAAAAYSLRRLRSSYTGPAVRVRRASNNDELDIYFNRDGSLDTATLETFCGGTDGFVKVWYDQGQGGNDATQATTASQPQIYDSSDGVIEEGSAGNEQPALSFVPFDNFPFDNSGLDIGSMSSFTVGTFTNTSGSQMMLGLSGGVANKRWYAPYLVSGNFNYGYGAQATYMNTPADTNQNLHTLIAGSTLGGIEAFLNSSSVGTQATLVSGIDLTNSGIMKLGTAFYTNGNLQEVIVYDSDQSANRQGIEDNINEHYGIYEFSGLLDDYSGAAAAYSLRRLSSTYTGPAIRVVKHDVGYPEIDIPFEDDGTLSVVLLEAFADGYDATVKVWYDQSGGSNDAEQSTLANQPKIVNAGTVIYENALPAVEFDGSADFMDLTGLTNAASDYSFFSVTKSNVALANAWTIDSQSGRVIFDGRGSALGPYYDGSWRGTAHNSTVQQLNAIFAIAPSSGTSYLNGSVINTGLAYTQKAIGGTVRLGRNSVASTNLWNGTMQEIVLYASDQTSNRTAIETNVNDFYSIYP